MCILPLERMGGEIVGKNGSRIELSNFPKESILERGQCAKRGRELKSENWTGPHFFLLIVLNSVLSPSPTLDELEIKTAKFDKFR